MHAQSPSHLVGHKPAAAEECGEGLLANHGDSHSHMTWLALVDAVDHQLALAISNSTIGIQEPRLQTTCKKHKQACAPSNLMTGTA